MPFDRPTLSALIDQSGADLVGRFPGADSGLRRKVLNVLARVVAASTHGLYGFQAFAARQMLPQTAEDEGVLDHASLWQVDRKPAIKADGAATFSGVNGTPIPVGTRLQRGDRFEYVTTAPGEIAAGVAQVAIEAAVAGSAGLASAGVALVLISPIAGVQGVAQVAAGGVINGQDEESLASLQARTVERIREKPKAGTKADYERWAKEVAQVTRAWCTPLWMGVGTVGVTFVCDGRPDVVPDAGDVAEVQAYLDDRAPAPATVIVYAPTPKATAFDLTITPDTPATRQSVLDQLRDLYSREAAPGATILLSHIQDAVARGDGITDYVVNIPAANVGQAAHEIAVLGAVAWSA